MEETLKECEAGSPKSKRCRSRSPLQRQNGQLALNNEDKFDNSRDFKQFFTNPGLIHIGENIFGELNHENLDKCSGVCQNWKTMLEDPKVWLTICVKKAPKHVGFEVGKYEASKIHFHQ